MPSLETARRYVGWLERKRLAIVTATALAGCGAVYLIAFHLPLYADFSHLLPQDAPAVRDLHELRRRLSSQDSTIALVTAPDPRTRAAAATEFDAGLRALRQDLVVRVETDDRDIRDFIRAHRHLFVPLDDLIAARDGLRDRIDDAKVRANPLFVDVDDGPASDRLDALRVKRREADARLDRSGFVSVDGTTALIVIDTAFGSTDVARSRALRSAIDAIASRVRAAYPAITVGLAGGVPTAIAEHDALVRGMVWSSLVTALLVAVVLLLHLRSVRLLVLLTMNIALATTAAFGFAAVTVGHLNAATGFLGAVVAGNGVNYGILLIARYLEERGRAAPAEAMAIAIAATLRPTLVAALGASIAYGALAATSFRGFADFAMIGGAGMIVCWISSYVLLPALVLRFADRVRVRSRESVFARIAHVFRVRRPAVACSIGAAVAIAAGVVTWRYVAADPFEYDLRELHSETEDAIAARRWMEVADENFGHWLRGSSYVLVERDSQVGPIVAGLRRLQATPDGRSTIGAVFSIEEVVPVAQAQKREVLAEIRQLLDDPSLEELGDAERAELRELRPPDVVRELTIADLPDDLGRRFTERDGRVGTLIAIRPADGFDELDGRDLVRLAAVVRGLELPDHVAISGASLIFADIIRTIRRDGPIVTLVAALGLVVMVVLVVGRNRRAVAVLAGTFTGSLAMIAVCAGVGLEVTFLDFVALPIALGLGVDYAINVADRADRDDPVVTLRMTGATVLVCSLTTMIGYASLLLGDNRAIRGFGLASLIGEVTCVISALALVPAIMALRRRA